MKNKYYGNIPNSTIDVAVGSIKKGEVIRIYLLIENNIISNIKYEYYGCGVSINILESICDYLYLKNLNILRKLIEENIIDEFMNDIHVSKCANLVKFAFIQLLNKMDKEAK